jgi:hypothetical protein
VLGGAYGPGGLGFLRVELVDRAVEEYPEALVQVG